MKGFFSDYVKDIIRRIETEPVQDYELNNSNSAQEDEAQEEQAER